MKANADTADYSREVLCRRIAKHTQSMMDFWKQAGGWAPFDAAGLLNKSMLEWQSSLAVSLEKWVGADSTGDLILAWANLGALVEGQLKLFLCVYYNDYRLDIDAIKRKGHVADPDGCELEPLRQFFLKRIWSVGFDWDPYVMQIQRRRNAIHAFKNRDIGTFIEGEEMLRLHLSFVRDLNSRLPYPDDCYIPREV